jgi:hypothetical protein
MIYTHTRIDLFYNSAESFNALPYDKREEIYIKIATRLIKAVIANRYEPSDKLKYYKESLEMLVPGNEKSILRGINRLEPDFRGDFEAALGDYEDFLAAPSVELWRQTRNLRLGNFGE